MKAFNLFSWQRSLRILHLLLFLCHEVAANTEIINFSSSRERSVDLPLDVLVGNWSKLHPSDNERRWSLEPAALHTPLHQVCEHLDDSEIIPFSCPHELWVHLDLDDDKWASYSTFTLRLSWPASSPTDFAITLYAQHDLLARLSDPKRDLIRPATTSTTLHASAPAHSTTRTRYARVRAVHAGVASAQRDNPGQEKTTVAFFLVLEPTYWGILPASVLPTIGFLVPIVFTAIWLVTPRVILFIEPFVRQAREDCLKTRTRTRKQW